MAKRPDLLDSASDVFRALIHAIPARVRDTLRPLVNLIIAVLFAVAFTGFLGLLVSMFNRLIDV